MVLAFANNNCSISSNKVNKSTNMARWLKISLGIGLITCIIITEAFVVAFPKCDDVKGDNFSKTMASLDPFCKSPLQRVILILQYCLRLLSWILCAFTFYNLWINCLHKIFLLSMLWIVFAWFELGVTVFLIFGEKEPKEEMASLYETFSKYSQDTKFVGHFEHYQRENSCCGIFGADDWLLVQLRYGLGSGGGGGGYESLDYGFRQNPSAGKCHLAPSPIPMGCGQKILMQFHSDMLFFVGIMTLQLLGGLIYLGLVKALILQNQMDEETMERNEIIIPEEIQNA